MRFKVDENLLNEAAFVLRDAGHDVVTALEEFPAGTEDHVLASACRNEQRILLTCDLDFADIRTYPPDEYPGLIVFRLRRQSRPRVLAAVAKLMPMLVSEPLKGRLWIVDEDSMASDRTNPLTYHPPPGTEPLPHISAAWRRQMVATRIKHRTDRSTYGEEAAIKLLSAPRTSSMPLTSCQVSRFR
jgi:predicted nuclease of predicted toxin-antitoxin system